MSDGGLHTMVFHNVVGGRLDHYDRGLGRLHVDRFRREIEAIRQRYEILPLDVALDVGRGAAAGVRGRRRIATITFDDGFAGVHRYAGAVLDKLGLVATVFVMTEPGGAMRPDGLLHFEQLEIGFRLTTASVLDGAALGLGPLPLDSTPARFAALKRAKRVLKLLPEASRRERTAAILAALAVSDDRIARYADGERHEDQEGRDDPPGNVGRMRFRKLSLLELRALQAAGWTIGGHTRSHRTLSRLDDDALRYEVIGCARDLAALGIHDAPFAYPYGGAEHFDDRVVGVVAEAGFAMAFTTISGASHAGTDRYRLGRDATLWDSERLPARAAGPASPPATDGESGCR